MEVLADAPGYDPLDELAELVHQLSRGLVTGVATARWEPLDEAPSDTNGDTREVRQNDRQGNSVSPRTCAPTTTAVE